MNPPACWRHTRLLRFSACSGDLRADGYAIILITHKIREVLGCADRITTLRAGRVSGQLARAEANEKNLVELMFGKRDAGPVQATASGSG